jgi:hypothetical protein
MIIQIETKTGMSEKVLDVLNGLKDVIIDKIEIQDKAYIEKQNELNTIYCNAIDTPESLKSHEDVWKEIENRTK